MKCVCETRRSCSRSPSASNTWPGPPDPLRSRASAIAWLKERQRSRGIAPLITLLIRQLCAGYGRGHGTLPSHRRKQRNRHARTCARAHPWRFSDMRCGCRWQAPLAGYRARGASVARRRGLVRRGRRGCGGGGAGAGRGRGAAGLGAADAGDGEGAAAQRRLRPCAGAPTTRRGSRAFVARFPPRRASPFFPRQVVESGVSNTQGGTIRVEGALLRARR